MNNNIMFLNNKDIGISKIKLDKSALSITDKSGKYSLIVLVYYNWRDINTLQVGEQKQIDFNEYYLAENNESALIWPTLNYVEKISNDELCFYLKFTNLSNTTNYMNKRGYFDIALNSLETKVFINYQDAYKGSIIYKF